MPSQDTIVALLGPYGISAQNSATAQTVVANVWGGLSVLDGNAKTITVLDGLSATGRTIAVFDAPTRGDYAKVPVNLTSGNLTVSCISATSIAWYFR